MKKTVAFATATAVAFGGMTVADPSSPAVGVFAPAVASAAPAGSVEVPGDSGFWTGVGAFLGMIALAAILGLGLGTGCRAAKEGAIPGSSCPLP